MPSGLSQTTITKLEQIAKHSFEDKLLLAHAVTHSSYFANDAKKKFYNYERLEFLGDRVLGICVAQLLFALFPQANEGELSKRFNALVNAESCAIIAQSAGLVDLIRMGPELQKRTDKPHINIYADIIESFIAAMSIDGGLDVAYKFVESNWRNLILAGFSDRSDAKSTLQEWAHKQKGEQPVYRLIERRGTDHDPIFLIEVKVEGFSAVRAEGPSKRKAQTNAANKLLEQEGIW